MTIWNVMKTYDERSVYYQVLPYSTNVLRVLLCMNHGLCHMISFIWNSRWSENSAYKLASKKNAQ